MQLMIRREIINKLIMFLNDILNMQYLTLTSSCDKLAAGLGTSSPTWSVDGRAVTYKVIHSGEHAIVVQRMRFMLSLVFTCNKVSTSHSWLQ